jgi:hypothetical protein
MPVIRFIVSIPVRAVFSVLDARKRRIDASFVVKP